MAYPLCSASNDNEVVNTTNGIATLDLTGLIKPSDRESDVVAYTRSGTTWSPASSVGLTLNGYVPQVTSGDTIGKPDGATGFYEGASGALFLRGGAISPLWHADYDFGDDGVPTLTNDSAKMDIVSWVAVKDGSTYKIFAVIKKGFTHFSTVPT